MKLARPKAAVTIKKAVVCSSLLCVKVPMMCGKTGTIRPIEIMSIKTVTKIKGMAAWRLWWALPLCESVGWVIEKFQIKAAVGGEMTNGG